MLRDQSGAVPLLVLVGVVGIIAVIFLLNFAPFKNTLLSSLYPKPASQAASPTDWPMFQGDPQHTGSAGSNFTPVMGSTNCQLTGTQDVNPCMQVRWKKSYSEWPNGLSQTVVSSGTVFQANMDGKLYAYDETTGTQKWVFDAGSPIGLTPAIINSKIFFGDFSGKIYSLNVSTGAMVANFPVQTGGPIYSSPVVFSEAGINKLFIGSNDGKLYGLNADSGAQLFTPFDTGGSMIYSNPAFYSGKVYFGAENMNAYAINSSTGQLAWSKKLDGESNRGDHPIIVTSSNTVLFRTVPRFGSTGSGLKDLFDIYGLQEGFWKKFPDLAGVMADYQSQVLAGTSKKSMYLFDATTGNEVNSFTAGTSQLSMIALNNWYSGGQNVPVVFNNQYLIFGSFGGYVKLDTLTKQFTAISKYQSVRGDEYTGLTLSSNWLYGGYLANISKMKVDGTSVLAVPDSASYTQLHGCKDCGDPPPYQTLDAPLSSSHWQSYTGDGYSNNGSYFIIANGHGYYKANGWLYAF